MTTHTPGPWHWVDGTSDLPYDFAGGNAGYPSLRSVEEFGENKTTEVDGRRYTSYRLPKFILDADQVPEADAHLIAAAPDLLEMLAKVVGYGYVDPKSPFGKLCTEAVAKASPPPGQ